MTSIVRVNFSGRTSLHASLIRCVFRRIPLLLPLKALSAVCRRLEAYGGECTSARRGPEGGHDTDAVLTSHLHQQL